MAHMSHILLYVYSILYKYNFLLRVKYLIPHWGFTTSFLSL
jgi:hypothetical protein